MKQLFFIFYLLFTTALFGQMLVPQKNFNDRITFYALGTVNGATDDVIKSITASGRLGVKFNLGSDVHVNIGANLLNANPATKIKKDSVDFTSLMFPETGNFGFMFNPSLRLFRLKAAEHSLWLDGTFTYRKMAIDSPNVSFKVNAVNVGVKYIWNHNQGTVDNFIFTFMPYWNLFNIPDEDVKKFNSLLNDPLFEKINSKAELYSIGMKTSVQFQSFIFFADLRRNRKTTDLDDNNPLKGTKFNIGFSTYLKLKSVN
jgi:hypothetical protein